MAGLDEGRVIGSYRVVRCLGRGGMGTVYEVEHVELGVHYALKTFTFDPANDASHALKAKFLEEGKVLARLKHPNIAHVFDLAFDEETQMPYFVMDLVTYEDGESYTAEDVDLSDIEEDVVYGWFKELASALDYIHEQGIVHRDIKPSNLLMDKDAHVILTDFGISRIFGERLKTDVDATQTMVTKTGRGKLVFGTEKYIAPEVGRGEEAVPESDAYSLGVMVLRWLTGFFYKDNPGALALLSQKKYHWLPVIARLLAPTPDRRPKTYTDLVKQLKPIAKGRAASMRPPQESTEQKAKKKRNKMRENIIAATVGLFVIGLVAGAGWFGYQGWCKYEADKKENAAQLAAIKQQMRNKEAAEAKAKAEAEAVAQKKAAEEKRIAAEKEAARKARIAERERLEAARVEVSTPKDEPHVDSASSLRQKGSDNTPPKREKMVIVKDEDETDDGKDYGPIPNVKYKWFAGQGNENPLRVDFQMSSGAKIELMPMKKGIFFMSNNWDDKKVRHKVTLTRPFWVSKFCVTAAQWREFDEGHVADCLPIEKALQGQYPVSKKSTREQFDAFCKFMTLKYKSQIPAGYVFRLSSEAEWMFAFDFEGTSLHYGQSYQSVDGAAAGALFKKIDAQFGLSKIRNWSANRGYGWSGDCFVGGIILPHVSGVCDLFTGGQMVLDTVHTGIGRIGYTDDEIDPLRWDQCCRISVRRGDPKRYSINGLASIAHLVLGPDLIKEKAWENPRVNIEHKVPVPNRHYAWANPDKVPKLIKKPKELIFKMAEGGDMIFCTIPSVKEFNMSNPDGQDKLYHKVTLTKPFWITKYCVTTKQWREYAKYDCEGIVREVEKYFPKNPIYMPFTRSQWDGFCEYLNKRYGHQLPKGYVFRLPTEAEWEWAFVGDKIENIRKMPRQRFDPGDERFKLELARLAKKQRLPKSLSINPGGQIDTVKIGGRVDCTETFGVCDMLNADTLMFDTFDVDGIWLKDGEWDWDGFHIGALCSHYGDCEIDPVNYAGGLATRTLRRIYHCRIMDRFEHIAYAHIVVAPDIETALKKKQVEPHPTEDFGGKLLSEVIEHGGLSSKSSEALNLPERFKRMLSTENRIEEVLVKNRGDDYGFGFETKVEDSPWIQLNLDKKRIITGLKIDALSIHCYNRSVHLRVWTSEDGKTWREVASENQRKHRYCFDLQRKNVKASFIRIGREPGFSKDRFSLDKILIYGK